MDYEKILKSLKICSETGTSCEGCSGRGERHCIANLTKAAAIAVETLLHTLDMAQRERDVVTKRMIELEQEVCRLRAELVEKESALTEIFNRTYGPLHQKIGQWLQAEQEGRLVVLPCKVGDTVYVIGESCDFCETYLDEPERCMRCEKGHYVEERGFELWMLSELNESIFLTREEAEAELAGKGGEG